MSERITAINNFVPAGCEVHANFTLIMIHEGWEAGWKASFAELDAELSPAAKAAEV